MNNHYNSKSSNFNEALKKIKQIQIANEKRAEVEKSDLNKTVNKSTNNLELEDNFFIPSISDLGNKDCWAVMDVCIVRLSKTYQRKNDSLTYKIKGGEIQVNSGADGMATIWDYDLIIMGISYLTEAMNRYSQGRGEKPGRVFKPKIIEVINFLQKRRGGKQYELIEKSLKRLATTHVTIKRVIKNKFDEEILETQGESLINRYKVIRNQKTSNIESLEIELPYWIWKHVVESKNPKVLTVSPDYFLINSGIARFVYRLARQAAGKTIARWSFETLLERSGSPDVKYKFNYKLRQIIKDNNLPDYYFSEETGKNGPIFVMENREYKERKDNEDDNNEDD